MITIDYGSPDQQLSWGALLQLHEMHPEGWTLVGGQMVHLHCWERGLTSARVTADADAGLDVRGYPEIAWSLTTTLQEVGFTLAGTRPNGVQHRWVRPGPAPYVAQIDVVMPHHVGQRASARKTAAGGVLLESFGIQLALGRSSAVLVGLDGVTGRVNRPSLLGSLVCKAAALKNVGDSPKRHLDDFLILSALLTAADLQEELTKRDREHLGNAVGTLVWQGRFTAATQRQERGIRLIQAALSR